MTEGDRRKRDTSFEDDEIDPLDGGSARRARAVTLTMKAPPLVLPGEVPATVEGSESAGPTASSAARPESPRPSHLDAWTLDRLRRSSLPPAMAQRAVSVLPPAARTATPLEGLEPSDDGDVLSLVGRAGVALPQTADLVGELADNFALGDFTGALRVAELLLGQDPAHDLAQHYARSSREKLEGIYTSRLSVGGEVPELTVPESELRWLGLDPQIAMVLARVDGRTPLDHVIRLSGVPRLDALRALVELLSAKVIRLV